MVSAIFSLILSVTMLLSSWLHKNERVKAVYSFLNTSIHSSLELGRNRQVRKMFEAVNNSVDFLKRIKIGDLTVSGLDRGQVRSLTPREVDYLLNI